MDDFNYYHVDPRTTRGDAVGNRAGRYPPNFVKFPWFLEPLNWGDVLSRAHTGRPAFLLKDSLLKVFDAVDAPAERWGAVQEIGVLRRNLEMFSDGIDENPYVSPIGRVLIKAIATANLKNRAETITFCEANREFIEANSRFKAPVIVTGIHRTGTTLLQRLLSEDPNTRSPYTYEMEKITPPLKAGVDPLKDPRIEKSAGMLALLSRLAPGFLEKLAEQHLMSPVEKEESLFYMQLHNGLNYSQGLYAGRNYLHGMHQPEVAGALMKYERNFFTLLDAYCPARSHWTLKSPSYAPYFSKIFDHYPGARVVVTHRHPSKNFASVYKILETGGLPFGTEGSFDKIRFGHVAQDVWNVYLSRPLEFRQANPRYESQITDCMYQDLIRDPIAMVKDIYAKFDLEYTPEFEDRMKNYLANNQQGKHGRHKYTNEEYGVDPYALYAQNKNYFDHYGFTPEPGSAD